MLPVRLLLIEGKVLVATVSMQAVTAAETERLRWAMNATGIQLGLIVNFHGTTLKPHFIRAPA